MPRLVFVACVILSVRVVAAAPEGDARPLPSKSPEQPAATSTASPRPDEPQPTPGSAAALAATSTPKGALKFLAAALRDGDADRIRLVMHATNPSEQKMIAAMADMAKAMAALQKSAVKAFGKEGAKEVVGDTDATDAESKARIDSADVKIQGDTATVTMEDGEEAPVVLKRIDGHWKMPMSELSRGADLAALGERLAGLAEQAKLVRELADEVAANKYATPAQAHEAWQSRAMQASMRRPPSVPSRTVPKRAKVEDRG